MKYGWPQHFCTWKTTTIFGQMEDDLNILVNRRRRIKITENNGCGTAPGNLVYEEKDN